MSKVMLGDVVAIGHGSGSYVEGDGLDLGAAWFKPGQVCTASARGDLQVSQILLRRHIDVVLGRLASEAGDAKRGAPNAVLAIADALTALRLTVEEHNGSATQASWWHRMYFRIVAAEHFAMFPGVAVPDPYAERYRLSQQAIEEHPPAPVVSIAHLRAARSERAAAEAERARLAAALVEQADGQLRAAF